MTDTSAIGATVVLLLCVGMLDATFGGNGALFTGCIMGMFFGSLIESRIERKPR